MRRPGEILLLSTYELGHAPHGLALDSRGDIYVGEVSWTIAGQHLKPPREMRSLQKLVKQG